MNSRVGVFGARRKSRLVATLAIAMVIAVLGTACSGSPGSSAPTPAPHVTFPLPHPGAGPDFKLLPKPAPDPGGTVLAAATTLAKKAAGGGQAGLAALLTALKRSGIALIDADGSVVAAGDKPPAGLEVPVGEVIAAANQNNYDHGLTAGQIASTFDALFQDKASSARLETAIFTDLARQGGVEGQYLTSIPKTTAFLSSFIIELGLKAAPANDLRIPPAGNTQLTGLQTWLLWLAMASGAYDDAAAKGSHKTIPASPTAYRSGRTADGRPVVLTGSGPCTVEAKDDNDPNIGGKVLDAFPNLVGLGVGGAPLTGFDGIAGWIAEALGAEEGVSPTLGVGGWTSIASMLLSLAHLASEGFGLNASMEMEGGEPLVRTMSTTQDGEEKTIKLTLSYDIGAGQYANCLRQVLNLGGVDLTLPNNGPVKGATVFWHLPSSGDYGYSDFVQFDLHGANPGTDGISGKTNEDGETTIDLQGKRQRFKVPEGTKPFERPVTILAGIEPKDSNLFNDLNDAVGAFISATGGPAAVITSIVTSILDRSQFLSVQRTFIVRDWPPDFKVDSPFLLSGATYNGVVTGIKCNGVEGEWTLHGGGGSFDFTLDENGQGHLGPSQVTLLQGDPATLQFVRPGLAIQKLVVIPGNFPECQSER